MAWWRMVVALAAAGWAAALCPDQSTLLKTPSDPGAIGPYAVGAKFLGNLTVSRHGRDRVLPLETWYPAHAIGNQPSLVYDLREWLPPKDAAKLPGSAKSLGVDQPCEVLDGRNASAWCYRDLPLAAAGTSRFPVIVFIHGTAGFRTQSLHLVTHWASRGFVVIAADYPGINLRDLLEDTEFGPKPPAPDQAADTRDIIAALRQGTLPMQSFFPKGSLDFDERLAVIGHSAGAFAAQRLGDVAQVLVLMAGGGVEPTAPHGKLQASLILAGHNDTVVGWPGQEVSGYARTPGPRKAFAVANNLGHHFCSDICWVGADKGGIAKIALDHGIWQSVVFGRLADDGCQFVAPAMNAPVDGWLVSNYASSAVLEETLKCDSRMAGKVGEMPSVMGKPILFEARQHEGGALAYAPSATLRS